MEAGAYFHGDPGQATTHPDVHAVRDAEKIGSGWVAFAGAYLMITGLLNLVWGVTALTKTGYFAENGLVVASLELWGWIAVVIAVVQFTAGLLIFARKVAGVVMAIFIASLSIIINFMTIGAYPVWSSIAIVCSLLVLWAVTVHGEDFAA